MKAFLPFIIWPSGIGLLRAKSGPYCTKHVASSEATD